MKQDSSGNYEFANKVTECVPEPLVTVRTLTYQHAPFIRDCIEGVLMQKTSFPVEYIIGEDCSTDGTREIVFDYAKKYPEKIRVVTADYNVGGINNGKRCRQITRGKYVALCEGDDYWTDPGKLQKQIDFLESNPGYSFCCGGFKINNLVTGETRDNIKPTNRESLQGHPVTFKEMLNQWTTQTLTMVYKDSAIDEQELARYKHLRDVHLIYHLLKHGDGYYIDQVLGVYRVHSGGIFSAKPYIEQLRKHCALYKELFELNNDEFSRKMYLKVTLLLLQENIRMIPRRSSPRENLHLINAFLSNFHPGKDIPFIVNGILKKIRSQNNKKD